MKYFFRRLTFFYVIRDVNRRIFFNLKRLLRIMLSDEAREEKEERRRISFRVEEDLYKDDSIQRKEDKRWAYIKSYDIRYDGLGRQYDPRYIKEYNSRKHSLTYSRKGRGCKVIREFKRNFLVEE